MTVFLKNVETGYIFEIDGENDAIAINRKLLEGKYELVNKGKIDKEELEKLEIPEIPTTQPTKNRLLNKKR